jgi:hypothetical protein
MAASVALQVPDVDGFAAIRDPRTPTALPDVAVGVLTLFDDPSTGNPSPVIGWVHRDAEAREAPRRAQHSHARP